MGKWSRELFLIKICWCLQEASQCKAMFQGLKIFCLNLLGIQSIRFTPHTAVRLLLVLGISTKATPYLFTTRSPFVTSLRQDLVLLFCFEGFSKALLCFAKTFSKMAEA